MPTDPFAADRDIQLTDQDFLRIAQIVREIAGIVLAEAKRPLVHSRLMRRLKALGLKDFASYADVLELRANEAERVELITAVTTNVTSFFRERHHFETLATHVVPHLMQKAQLGHRIRLWSAGCSSGEEPYSMAATVLSVWPEAHRFDLRILATDIDRTMVARTREAMYPAEAAASLEVEQARRLFTETRATGTMRICDPVRQMVTCNALNLNESWPMKGPFEVIFCRNVVIYFDKPTQETLWKRFALMLAPGGRLMIGHSERITGPALDDFIAEGITTYRRR